MPLPAPRSVRCCCRLLRALAAACGHFAPASGCPHKAHEPPPAQPRSMDASIVYCNHVSFVVGFSNQNGAHARCVPLWAAPIWCTSHVCLRSWARSALVASRHRAAFVFAQPSMHGPVSVARHLIGCVQTSRSHTHPGFLAWSRITRVGTPRSSPWLVRVQLWRSVLSSWP